jgi:hypothetical protein
LFEEGQSRRRVAEGPMTGVVVRLGEESEVVGVGVVEFAFVFELELLWDTAAPTPPPTAAPITTIETPAKIIQKVFGLRPHSFCGGGGRLGGCSWYWYWSPYCLGAYCASLYSALYLAGKT